MIPWHLNNYVQIVLKVPLNIALMLVLVALGHANVSFVNLLERPSEHPDIALLQTPIDIVERH
jgi:hypothetical protein